MQTGRHRALGPGAGAWRRQAAAKVAGNRERDQEMRQVQQLRLGSLARVTHSKEGTGLSLVFRMVSRH